MTKIISLLSLFYYFAGFSQTQLIVLESYPSGQEYYMGGRKALNQELKEISVKLDLAPCGANETYRLAVLVNNRGSIKLIKDEDSLAVQKNKCAAEFSKKLLPHLHRWLPAKIGGKEVDAITTIDINPYIIYKSKPIVADNVYEVPVFKLGMDEFRSYMTKALKKTPAIKESRYMEMIFAVSDTGMMVNVEVIGTADSNVIKAVTDAVEKLNQRKLWRPGTINGYPMYRGFRLPILEFASS